MQLFFLEPGQDCYYESSLRRTLVLFHQYSTMHKFYLSGEQVISTNWNDSLVLYDYSTIEGSGHYFYQDKISFV